MNQSQLASNISISRNGEERIASLEKEIIMEYENLVANVDRVCEIM